MNPMMPETRLSPSSFPSVRTIPLSASASLALLLAAVSVLVANPQRAGAAEGTAASPKAAPAVSAAASDKGETPGKAGKPTGGKEMVLFDGKTLTGWKETDFAGRGPVKVENGRLLLETGVMTGVTWTNADALPRMDYELELEAMRVDGSDFFCGLTFPAGAEPLSFIVGGWGGGVVGLSSINGEDAAHNETTSYLNFENGKWFKIRLRVTKARIEAWIDGDRVVNLETMGKTFSIRPEVELSKPLGIASWATSAALRNIRVRRL